MQYFLRSEITDALEDPKVEKILPRYVRIVRDGHPVNFQIARRILVEFDKSMSNQQLWQMHRKGMNKFYEAKVMIDKGKLDINELELPRFSLLDLKILLTKEVLKSCTLCERRCKANRTKGEVGECKVSECMVSSEFIHMGEEPFISPSHTIFFMGCNFHCEFCQNWKISQWKEPGQPVSPLLIAKMIERGKRKGCRNVNFVGGEPTPHLLAILEALNGCKANQAVVWNSNFFMSEHTMSLLDGVVDLYLSDLKYGNDECAERLSKARNYFYIATRNHIAAAEQAELAIRHLMLPDHLQCCTIPVLDWIGQNVKDCAVVNIMDQYRPEYNARENLDIKKEISQEEYDAAVAHAKKLGINFIE